MPKLSGLELYAQARSTHPGIKVILISGYSKWQGLAVDAEPQDAIHLQKPFQLAELRRAVQRTLGEGQVVREGRD